MPLSKGAVVGISVAAVAVALIIGVVTYLVLSRTSKKPPNPPIPPLPPIPPVPSISGGSYLIQAIVNNQVFTLGPQAVEFNSPVQGIQGNNASAVWQYDPNSSSLQYGNSNLFLSTSDDKAGARLILSAAKNKWFVPKGSTSQIIEFVAKLCVTQSGVTNQVMNLTLGACNASSATSYSCFSSSAATQFLFIPVPTTAYACLTIQ